MPSQHEVVELPIYLQPIYEPPPPEIPRRSPAWILVVCAVIALVAVIAIPLAGAGVDAAVGNLKLHYRMIDSSLADGKIAQAQSYLRSAQRDVATADDADLRDTQFVKLKARLPEYVKKIERAQSAGEVEQQEGQEAYQAEKGFRDGKDYMDTNEPGRAIENFSQCITRLDQLFKKNPDWKTRPSDSGKMTNGELLASCQEAKHQAEAAKASSDQAKTEKQAELLGGSVVDDFTIGMTSLAEAKKLERAGGAYAAVDAYNRYAQAAERLGGATRDFGNSLREFPALAQRTFTAARKKLTGAELLAAARDGLETARRERDALQSKYEKETYAIEQAYRAMPGARGKLAREHTSPSWFEGDESTVAQALASARRAPYWRYDTSDCKITYYFRGDAIARVQHDPEGCQ